MSIIRVPNVDETSDADEPPAKRVRTREFDIEKLSPDDDGVDAAFDAIVTQSGGWCDGFDISAKALDRNEWTDLFVAKSRGRVVGFLLAKIADGKPFSTASILYMCVLKEYAKRGAGRALVSAYHETIGENTKSAFSISTVFPHVPATDFYVKQGYSRPRNNSQTRTLFFER